MVIADDKTSTPRHAALLLVAWLAAIGIGMVAVTSYAFTPGAVGVPAERWPEESAVQPQPHRPALLAALHPHCPCSRATVGELARIAAEADGRLDMVVAIYKPAGAAQGWERSELFKTAAEIPGVRVITDIDGAVAAAHGARTSGHVVLYNAERRRRFSGGITIARGHPGDSPGFSAVIDFLNGAPSSTNDAPVFGCSLFEPDASTRVSANTSPGDLP